MPNAIFIPSDYDSQRFGNQINSNQKAQKTKRNSNIEFLRIVAMFMVLALHVNFFSLHSPTVEECHRLPLQSFSRIFFELFCIYSVNLFVFISGWFGIKSTPLGLFKYLFQCVVVLGITYVIGLVLGYAQFNKMQILEIIFAQGNAWFVLAYLFLYILAPVLNSFCEGAKPKLFLTVVISFYLFQTIYGNLFNSAAGFLNGYSAISFVGIYLLARYMRIYGKRIYKYGLTIFVVSVVLLVICYYVSLCFGIRMIGAMKYTFPFNVTAALGLIVWVANMKPRYNKFVNVVAASAFAVYLCHVCLTWTITEYKNISAFIFENYSGCAYFAVIILFMVAVFVAAVLIDRVRMVLWKQTLKASSTISFLTGSKIPDRF